MIDLDELERLHEAATPGPWVVEYASIVAGDSANRTMTIYDEGGHGPEEAALIAAMRNALPELLRLARRARRLEVTARQLLAALEEAQDWDWTRVGACMNAVENALAEGE